MSPFKDLLKPVLNNHRQFLGILQYMARMLLPGAINLSHLLLKEKKELVSAVTKKPKSLLAF